MELRMNLGLCMDRVDSFHLLLLDTDTITTTRWFYYRCSHEAKVQALRAIRRPEGRGLGP
jgi:hypothetical protein